MSIHFEIAAAPTGQLCSINGCMQPASRGITASVIIPMLPGVKFARILTLFLCETCDLELRQELNR